MCMCGITGWIDWEKDLSSAHAILEKMANILFIFNEISSVLT